MVGKLVGPDSVTQREFARENVIKSLITLLFMDTILNDPKTQPTRISFYSPLHTSKESGEKSKPPNNYSNLNFSFSSYFDGISKGGHKRKERGVESPEIKLKPKISCAWAL